MSANTAPRTDRHFAPWAAAAAAAGAAYGLGLARFLFELDPQRFGLFSAWPGALLLGVGALFTVVALARYTRRLTPSAFPYAPWAFLALGLPLFSVLSPDVNLLRSITLLLGSLAFCLLQLLPVPTQKHHSLVLSISLPLSLFLLLFVLYLRTLAPAVGQADTFEFQVDVARLGIAHGSGYPLLMLVGRLFSWLPVGGTLAFRANLSSAFFGALAAVGVERLSRRLGAAPLVASLAGLAFGVSPALWSRAVEIEVFALNAAFVAAILYLCLDLILIRENISNLQYRLMLLAFLYGLSLTNHLTALFLGPACLVAALTALRRQRFLEDSAQFSVSNATDPSTAPARSTRALQTPSAGRSSALSVLGPAKRSFVRLSLSVLRYAKRAFVLLSLLLGLSIYLYLPLRWPAVNHGEALSLAGFVNILTGNEAKGAFQWRLPFQDPGRYVIVWSKIVGEYGWAGLVLATIGVLSLVPLTRLTSNAKRQLHASKRTGFALTNHQLPITNYLILLLLLITSLGYLFFALAFNVPDPSFSSYLIPLHLITAILMALGVQWLLNLSGGLRHASLAGPSPTTPSRSIPLGHTHTPTHFLAPLLLTAFCLLPLRSMWRTFPLVDRSTNWSAQRLGELMLAQPLAQGAAILADSEKIAPLDYLQIAEGRRPDLDIIVLPDEASYRAALAERLAAGQVVYLGRYLPGLGAAYSLRSVGPLAEVSATPFTSTALAVLPALAQPAAAGINLVGYAPSSGVATLSAAAPGGLDMTLVWQARSVPTENLWVNLRLVDAAGLPAWQSSGSVPVSGLYPTNAWRAEEVVSDFYRLPVDPSLAPGSYQLQVALLPPFASTPNSVWTAVAPATILPPAQAPRPSHLLRAHFGANWLMGYDIPEAVAPGSRFAVTLYWLRSAESSSVTGPSYNNGVVTAHSIASWPVGALVPTVYRFTAPARGDQIILHVDAGVPAQCGWLAFSTSACPLPAVRLAGQAAVEGSINFDNQILLNRATLKAPSAAPGGAATINLEWQALRALAANYTVFVHLLGPDGQVHGQVDQWPVSGTRATSGWVPGESISDSYTIALPADAPPGAYQVEIGLYLLATGERLPVVNADGAPVDDRYLVSGLVVAPP